MTIHPEHPFLTPEDDRRPLRRFRGRMPLPVSLWTASAGDRQAGWTVSSLLVADGDPAVLLGLLDPEADVLRIVEETGAVAVSLLGWSDRALADAFAGVAPAPGGAFRLGSWTDTAWGPVLAGSPGWLGARLHEGPIEAGWSMLLSATVEHVEVGGTSADPVLGYLRGRYRALPVD